jgi:hypothetical protein
VSQAVNVLAACLQGTRFDISGAAQVQIGDAIITKSKTAVLAEGLTPLAAKYLPGSVTTPEAAAVMAIAMVFGGPLVQMALERAAGAKLAGAV